MQSYNFTGRYDSITIAKGIGIILMVIGHSGVPCARPFIYMFHMPLFFLLSGYCFKENHLTNFMGFAKRRAWGLYKPFVVYGLFFLALHNILFHINLYNAQYGFMGITSHLYTYDEFIKNAIGCILFNKSEQLIGGYWFLPQLFYASIIGWILIRVFHGKSKTVITVPLLLLLYIACIKIPHTSIGNTTFLAAVFFLIGYSMKKHLAKATTHLWAPCLALVLISSFFWPNEMTTCNSKTVIPYIISATAGSIMAIQISQFCCTFDPSRHQILCWFRRFLIYCGSHTIAILTWHFLSFKLATLLILLTTNKPIEMLALFPTITGVASNQWWILYCLLGIGLPLGAIYTKSLIQKKIT